MKSRNFSAGQQLRPATRRLDRQVMVPRFRLTCERGSRYCAFTSLLRWRAWVMARRPPRQEGHPLKGSWVGTWGPSPNHSDDVLIVLNWDGKSISGMINPGTDNMPIKNATLTPEGWVVHFEADGKDRAGNLVTSSRRRQDRKSRSAPPFHHWNVEELRKRTGPSRSAGSKNARAAYLFFSEDRASRHDGGHGRANDIPPFLDPFGHGVRSRGADRAGQSCEPCRPFNTC